MFLGDAILSRDDEGDYPLHKAIKYGDHNELLKALEASSSTSLNEVDAGGRSPLDLAGLSGQRELFDTLRRYGAKSVRVLISVLEISLDQIRAPNVEEYHFLIQPQNDSA